MESNSPEEKDSQKQAKEGIMRFMQKQIVVSLADLRYVSVHCPRCRTTVTLDMKEPSEFAKKYDGAFVPKECPGCREDYDTAIRPSVGAFQSSYHSLSEIAERVSFSGEPQSADV